ncbi:class I SAM-dependent methyltransferase [Janthinobacterium sp. NFX145]|uniref:class I SAM-dependent methyltransferase n=1 Tax=Janthinobacterium sp. NFX145 TaxID=3415602 RepID=UPI003CC569A8
MIFPAGMPRSLAYLDQALANGMQVVGSSSLGHDPARERYSRWVQLPYVTAPEFDQALRQAVAAHDIGSIYTPNPVVWDYLQRRLERDFPGLVLVNSAPLASEMAPYARALAFGKAVLAQPFGLAASGEQAPAAATQIAALFRHAETIPGMCDQEKIRALCEVFRYCPAGDVVEVGSWWGKSAFVLASLARCHGTGKLLCVDPWTSEHLVQANKSDLIDNVAWDASEALTVFQLNLLPYANGMVNYLRLPSVEAALEYRQDHVVETEAFGRTEYSGNIALLHIDGNHGYAEVRADIASWCDLVRPGGWIVMDDYAWAYGDGPRRATDEFLFQHAARISCAFFSGGALFIQVAS